MPKRYYKLKAKPGTKVYGRRPPTPFKELTAFGPEVIRSGADHSHIPSNNKQSSKTSEKQTHRYEGELAKREKAAREVAERRKKMIAPICNKGTYQYIGEAPAKEILRGLGRKI